MNPSNIYNSTPPMDNNAGRRGLSQSTTQASNPRFASVFGKKFAAKMKLTKKSKKNTKSKDKNSKKKSKNKTKSNFFNRSKKKNNKKNNSKNKSTDHDSSKSKHNNSSRSSQSKSSVHNIKGCDIFKCSQAQQSPQLPSPPLHTCHSTSDSSSSINQHQQHQQQTNENDEKSGNNSNIPHNIPNTRFKFDVSSDVTPEVCIELNGYKITKKIADTLQGKIYRCNIITYKPSLNYFNKTTVVIKVTSKELYNRRVTLMDNGQYKSIQEDIIKEKDLLRELTYNNAPASMVRYIDFFEDNNNYYLVLEDGGNDLFEYVVKCHNLLKKNKLNRKEWRLTVKKIFKQIVLLLDWLHNKQGICHLDISLENMLIENGHILQNIHNGKITLSRNFQIKFCDFGLSEKFQNNNYKCKKYVGKTRYKSPELWTKTKIFDARLNDIWSLGISLFMMVMGAPPIKYPDYNDNNFKLIINGQILDLIQTWNRAKYMTPQILELLQAMLTIESKRITLNQIKLHSWVNIK